MVPSCQLAIIRDNGTLHQVENHFNKLSNIGYVFNRQNKQDVEDNRFQHYLLITDLLEAHLAALLQHERINMIRAWESICRERRTFIDGQSKIFRLALLNG